MKAIRAFLLGSCIFVLALLLSSFFLGALAYILLLPYSADNWWLYYKISLLLVLVINTTIVMCPIIYTSIKRKGVTK
jgi:hypothetical protein